MHMRMHTRTGGGCFSSFKQLKAGHEGEVADSRGQRPPWGGRCHPHGVRPCSALGLSVPVPLPASRAPGLAHRALLASDTGGDAGHARQRGRPPASPSRFPSGDGAACPPGARVPASRCVRPPCSARWRRGRRGPLVSLQPCLCRLPGWGAPAGVRIWRRKKTAFLLFQCKINQTLSRHRSEAPASG